MSIHAPPGDAPAARVKALEQLLGESDVHFCKVAAEGNRAFERGDDVLAGWLHEDAMAEADTLFAAPREMSLLIAPMAYTIACNNAAEAKLRAGDLDSAHELKLRAVTRLITVAQSAAEPFILRLSCVRQLRHALAFLEAVSSPSDSKRRSEFEGLLEQYRTVSAELAKIAEDQLASQARARTYNPPPPGGIGTETGPRMKGG